MIILTWHDLLHCYLDEHLKGRASYNKMQFVASQWALHCPSTPTRTQLLQRQQSVCPGHYEAGATKANTELALIRAACRWGLYQERWQGGDPTAGIRKMKTSKRTRTGKQEELRSILGYFARAESWVEKRDRALYGLMLFTGCRPGEARSARLDAITPYGAMGCWQKGKTKNGQTQEIPLPVQYMPWLAAWKQVRPASTNAYLFPGYHLDEPMTEHAVKLRWHEMRLILGIHGLWNYDLRRTLVNVMGNTLKYDMYTVKAIINHYEGSALSHYYFKDFDSLIAPIQAYADWVWSLRDAEAERAACTVPMETTSAAPASLPPPVAAPSDEPCEITLSGREAELLVWFAHGESQTYIAAQLGISPKTVATYRARLLDKLRLKNTFQLIRYAVEHEGDAAGSVPEQTTLRPVIAPAVMAPTTASPPIAYRSRREAREEWPG